MRKLALLTTLLALPAALPAQNAVVARIPMRIDHNRAVLPVHVGSSGPFWLILDTGFGYDGALLFDTAGVDRSGMRRLSIGQVGGAGGGAPSAVLFDDSAGFRVGEARRDGHRVMMLTDGRFRGFPNQGAIGGSLLSHFAVEVNYDDSTLVLYDAASFRGPPGWTAIPITFPQRPVPWVTLRMQTAEEPPVELGVYIDFASREAVELLVRPVNRWTMPAVTAERVIGRGLSGDVIGRTGRVAAVTIGPFTLQNVEVQVIPAEVRQGSETGADAVIASGLLRGFNIVFDYAHQTMWLRPNRDWKE